MAYRRRSRRRRRRRRKKRKKRRRKRRRKRKRRNKSWEMEVYLQKVERVHEQVWVGGGAEEVDTVMPQPRFLLLGKLLQQLI